MRRRRKTQKETSKKIAIIIVGFGLLDIQLAYVLAFLDKPVPESLTIAIVTEIVAVALGYFIKAFKSKKEEEQIKLERDINKLYEEDS